MERRHREEVVPGPQGNNAHIILFVLNDFVSKFGRKIVPNYTEDRIRFDKM